MNRSQDDIYMQRALQLAQNGAGYVAPNPMVGAVIVYEGRIIGEGWHQKYGEAHAEVNAINSVQPQDRPLLSSSTMYVTLEPCSHYGKTPPCADLLVQEQLKRVVICNNDPHKLVAGKGIERLHNAGIEVETGVLEAEGRELNRRFFTFHEQNRPYIFLKWAQSADGYFTKDNRQQHWITGEQSRKLVHRWRSEEAAILVGTQTALTDNPKLDTRYWPIGNTPLRIVLDKNLRLPHTLNLFDGTTPTLIVTEQKQEHPVETLQLAFDGNILETLLNILHQRGIQSILVEGGAQLLNSFIRAGLWDEARVFHGTPTWGNGIVAPTLNSEACHMEMVGADRLYTYKNKAC